MTSLPISLFLALIPHPTAPADLEPEHARNPVLVAVLADGLKAGGASASLPAPTFRDDQEAGDQKAALLKIAGSPRALDEMTADSPSAPHRLTLRDAKGEGATIRSGDLFFILHTDFARIDPDASFRDFRSKPVEAANMRFETRLLAPDDLRETPAASAAAAAPTAGSRLTHSTGRLLFRIGVESTDRVVDSKSAGSIVFASRPDPRFGVEGRWPNRWTALTQEGGRDVAGPAKPYAGGVGYAKISKYKPDPGAIVVEAHFAFAEPTGWFDGEPVLRSKFGPVADDQVRRLRRELKKPGR